MLALERLSASSPCHGGVIDLDDCPVSRSWQGFGVGEVEGVGVGVAEVNVEGTVPGQSLVGSDLVELDPECFGFADQLEWVVDLFAVEPLVVRAAPRSAR